MRTRAKSNKKSLESVQSLLKKVKALNTQLTIQKSRTISWKEKAKSRSRELSRRNQTIKRQKLQIEKWRLQLKAEQAIKGVEPIAYHSYPLSLVFLAIFMNIKCNISYRSISKSLVAIGPLLGVDMSLISGTSVRNWVLKYGLYFLSHQFDGNQDTDQYVLICDESIQLGKTSLMLVLAVPISNFSYTQPLNMSTVKLLNLGVKPSWNSAQLTELIQSKITEQNIKIAYGISDKSSVLRKSYRDCDIFWVEDCTHKMARIIKKLLDIDSNYKSIVAQMNGLRSKWLLSKNSQYTPPNLRNCDKSRFNEIFLINKWLKMILAQWELMEESVKSQLQFIKELKKTFDIISDLVELTELFSQIFKGKGIRPTGIEQWEKRVQTYKQDAINCQLPLSSQADYFIKEMNEYLEKYKDFAVESDKQILCCSDIIESIFGRYKNKTSKIITEDVLKIVGYGKEIKMQDVKKALETIKMQDLSEWKKQNTVVSKLALIKRFRKNMAA